jgi:hypothetical protein
MGGRCFVLMPFCVECTTAVSAGARLSVPVEFAPPDVVRRAGGPPEALPGRD